MNMFRLDNKTAVITGGSSGIGKAVAKAFTRQGANVFILDMNKKAAEEVEKEIRKEGGSVDIQIVDVTNQSEVITTFRNIGKTDILVNSAGISYIGNIEKTNEDDFDKVFRVNVKGVYNCLYAAIPKMKQKGGVILNISSIAALVGLPDSYDACSGKRLFKG
jgi:2-keto-3-deoxy-L-fuconate dehydrogenase